MMNTLNEETIDYLDENSTQDSQTEHLHVNDAEEEDVNPDVITPSLEEQLQAMKDQWLRAMAESENIRKRGQREKEEAALYGATSFARDVVSVTDNLKRALDAMAQEDRATLPTNVQGFIDGVNMIMNEIDGLFQKHHIKKIAPLHEPFNAHVHQAMCEIPTNDHPTGIVVQVMQEGYMLHDRLLRPALVGVAKALS